MAFSQNPLVTSHVIGDVIDPFVPTVNMSVLFGSEGIFNGSRVKPSKCKEPPRISINGIPDQLYTLVMTDPDAPKPEDPFMREWVHWIVTDIPGGYNPIRGNEVVPYDGPWLLYGIHRYVLVLFRQNGPMGMVERPLSRAVFRTRDFAQRHNLGLPVAAMYFNNQTEYARPR